MIPDSELKGTIFERQLNSHKEAANSIHEQWLKESKLEYNERIRSEFIGRKIRGGKY